MTSDLRMMLCQINLFLLLDLKLCLTEEGYVIADENVVTDAYSVKCATQPAFTQLNIVSDLAKT